MAEVVTISRRATFSSAHRLHCKEWSEEQNRQVFGKCNWGAGHGHNYTVVVSLRGPVDPRSGMVVNLTQLKELMQPVLQLVDHRNLDEDVAFFRTRVSTAENMAVFWWQQLRDTPVDPLLYKVKVLETENNSAVYKGELA